MNEAVPVGIKLIIGRTTALPELGNLRSPLAVIFPIIDKLFWALLYEILLLVYTVSGAAKGLFESTKVR